ncbi:HlyD family efflux transporter periplasmic adaptor subunit [Thermanaerosceptrum fracticalcis]|uniref:HlyD family efflux transporter periplasmic adaptor subunit n=1 Tax=Thermanaerosceptrum fracticalcis TaxID=1712410 RepID=A0A7G6E385_THEFR|nr:HlyD family efflux transporter periplasmic adaptor subunit [Thermanaerosceptrum fracticalcis]QNB46539.1 HlyD family efflux transporter periplasmic adaptor subunit [Thermanaerosceptrum fracticalcis]
MEKRKKIAAVIVVLLLAGAAYWLYREYFPSKSSVIEATGTIEATSVQLSAKSPGTIKTLSIKAGDQVKKGQLVGEISRNDLLAQRERDELTVLKAEAALADLLSGAREQEIKEAEAAANTARVNFNRATDDFKRAEALFQASAIPQVDYEKAQAAVEISKNQLQAAEARLSMLRSGSRPDLINAARAEVERSKAVLKATEAMLEDLMIVSPIDGVVLTKNYQEGEFVQAGASLATVVNMEDLWIKVYIPTDDLPHIYLGQRVRFTISGVFQVFEGVVEEIATRGEYTPKTIQTKKERTNVVFGVKIRIKSQGGILKPGIPADVVFDRR